MLAASITKADNQFIYADGLAFGSQSGWYTNLYTGSPYYEAGYWWGRVQTNGALVGVITYSNTYPAGTYNLWLNTHWSGTGVTNAYVIATTGGSTNTCLAARYGGWSNILFTATSSFNSSTITFSNMLYGVNTFDWLIGIALLTDNTNLTESDDLWLDYTLATVTNDVDIVKGNLLPNSSFELKYRGGWGYSRKPGENMIVTGKWMNDAVVDEYYHGAHCAKIGNDNARVYIFSPVVRLRGIDNVYRKYTWSFYAKGTGTLTSVISKVAGTNDTYTINHGSMTGAWARYSANVYLQLNPLREMTIELSSSGNVWIDAVQLEEGTLTDYAPSQTVEHALWSSRNGAVFNTNETVSLSLLMYNNSIESTVPFHYDVYDYLNRKIITGDSNYVVASGFVSNSLSLIVSNGAYRIVSWTGTSPKYWDELVFSKAPLPATANVDTNQLLGIHNNYISDYADTNRLWGFSWNRGLSPGLVIDWSIIEPTEGNYDWDETDYRVNQITNRQTILASLRSSEPDWAMTNDYPRLDVYSNFWYTVVDRYKDRIHYWEDRNEPSGAYTTNQFATMLEMAAGAIKSADSTAYFISMGGVAESTDNSFVSSVWSLLSESAKTNINAFSVHLYPPGGTDWMQPDDSSKIAAAVYSGNYARAIGVDVWQTEMGAWQMGLSKTDKIGYPTRALYTMIHQSEEYFLRGCLMSLGVVMRQQLRILGNGYKHSFYYDGRLATYHFSEFSSNPTWWEYDDSLGSIGVAHIAAQTLLNGGYWSGKITNTTANTNIEAYLFSSAPYSIVCAWLTSPTNAMITVSASNVEVFDVYGNSLTTTATPLSRVPMYFRSSDATNVLHTAFSDATVVMTNDTTSPYLSIDSSPVGQCVNGYYRFKWTAIDDKYVNTDLHGTNVQVRYKINGYSDWSSYSPVRVIELSSITSGDKQLMVQAIDAEGNVSEIVTGPTFYHTRVPPFRHRLVPTTP